MSGYIGVNERGGTNKVRVLGGEDKEGSATMGDYMEEVGCSGCYGVLKGEELKDFIAGEEIEGRDIEDICMEIKEGFED
ncbi:BrxA/BrxB family bacilliredoxin [Staphylococcus saprophyticus]|uniref:BrxA/BrxB family bacilliredoxin n=1 Tax=Staphylococcus saprophyticus TaxID=29385 RepID=UPI0021B3D1F8|nr:BrxA/BrxB family bacilliredoxin [Staphylococcus saprophyticus]